MPAQENVPPRGARVPGWSLATSAVAAGRPVAAADVPLNTPVVFASTYYAGGSLGYAREGTPTVAALEDALGVLEGGTAVAYASGMAAINAVLDTLPTGAVVVAPNHSYTGTALRLAELVAAGRVQSRLIAIEDADAVARALPGATLLWLETPTNPLLEIADIAGAVAAARAAGVKVLVDNTFATPMRQRPLDLGADLALHSVTKLLAGHSDVLLGAVVTADADWAAALQSRRVLLGAAPGAMECYLALRGIRTLAVRVDRAEANAQELARRLQRHPSVTRVRYPGLTEHPGYEIAAAQTSGPGTVLAIETVGGAPGAERVCAHTRLWVHATSLGGVESLLERRRRWPAESLDVPESLIRLSVGIEDVEDLYADLAAALEFAPG